MADAARDRVVETVLPVLRRDGAGWVFVYPDAGREPVVTAAVEEVAPAVRVLLAPNPGPMTLDGTNTWLLGDPAAGPVVVVDPGPDDAGHRARLLAAAPHGVAAVLLTHRHADHSDGAPGLAAAAGLPVRAVDPAFRVGQGGLATAT